MKAVSAIPAATVALRIVRKIEVRFANGSTKSGTAFLAPARGRLLTCAHVVDDEEDGPALEVRVTAQNGNSYTTRILDLDKSVDLASLEAKESGSHPSGQSALPQVGEDVIFAGLPQGVRTASVFPGMVSAVGAQLIPFPRCEMIQIAGMINNGNSGGPLVNYKGEILGVITAKYVPLLQQIDKLRLELESIPQFPREVGLGKIDFAAFVNMTIKSMWQLAAVLRLVQVGTGWAVPASQFSRVGGS